MASDAVNVADVWVVGEFTVSICANVSWNISANFANDVACLFDCSATSPLNIHTDLAILCAIRFASSIGVSRGTSQLWG